MLYRIALEAARYDVEEAEDGREALAIAFARHPAFIITETRLAFINGYELCKLVSQDEHTCDVRVIVVSGDAHPADVARAWSAGADGVVATPCLPDTLLAELEQVAAEAGRRTRRDIGKSKMLRRLTAQGRSATRMHERFDTTNPPRPPPTLQCPSCDRAIEYQRSHIGGVSDRHSEQWDYFVCTRCGTFEYRQRTRKLRRVTNVATA
jgi:CheY-like chemotaxis protein